MGRRLLGSILAGAMLCLAVPTSAQQTAQTPPATAPDAAFAGHYYLTGVMETGSELLLRPDGSFEWYLSYGALDQFADGTWRREGRDIVLSAAHAARDHPLFAYVGTEPWSAEAEGARVRLRSEEAADAVRDRCPFLTGDWVSSPTIAIGPPANEQDAREAASRALTDALAARSAVEVLARKTMASSAERREMTDEIRSTMAAWQDARDKARIAAVTAGQQPPELADPQLPEACKLPAEATVDADAPQTWGGGIAVRVVDTVSGQSPRDVEVTLRFADGREVMVKTSGNDGPDVLEDDVSGAVVGATLQAYYAPGRDAAFSFAPVSRGVLRFSIDANQLTAAPFETMHLHIDGKALVPDEFGKGRYERAAR